MARCRLASLRLRHRKRRLSGPAFQVIQSSDFPLQNLRVARDSVSRPSASGLAWHRNRAMPCMLTLATEQTEMSVEGKIKEGAGYIKEEMNEHGKDPESKRKAQEGRDLRNEGRVEDGKAPKTTPPGTGH